MFARSAVAFTKPVMRRNMSTGAGLPGFLYNNVWGKSTARYVTSVILGLVVADYAFHGVFESMWDNTNKGKLYKDIDWTKFKTEGDDEEEEEEEEE